jgi:CRP-like cAMP-binding protein
MWGQLLWPPTLAGTRQGCPYRMDHQEDPVTETVHLKDVFLFSELAEEPLAELAAALRTRSLAAGEVLFNQGDPGDELFVVQAGNVAIYIPSRDRPGTEQPIRIFAPGEALGEMALIDRRPRSLSARALEASQVLALTGDDFRRLLRQHPDVALAAMGGLSDRIRYTTDFLGEVREWVQRIAAGEYERGFSPSADYHDRSIAALAAEFAQMAATVRQREEALRQEVAQLRFEIDQAKKERQVGEIVESEYFQKLRAEAQKLREQR